MRAAGINRQFMANVGDRLAGRPLEPRRPPAECRLGAQLPDGCHVTRAPSGSSLDQLPDPVRSFSLAPGTGVGPLHDATSRRGLPSRAAPEGFSCAHARTADERAAAELTVPVSDGVLLMLRLAASAAGISVGEAIERAICRYADSLGLQVLADAMALDPDLARDLAAPATISRFNEV
jgi:hypothetical protein